MANYCSIKINKTTSTEDIGDMIKQYFQERFDFNIEVEIESQGDTCDSLALKFKDVNMYMWVYHNDPFYKYSISMFDNPDTCYNRSDNDDSKYDPIQERYFIYDCGYTYMCFLAQKFKTKIDSDGVGKFDPAKDKCYVLNYDNAYLWVKDLENPFSSKGKEESYFPKFHKKG